MGIVFISEALNLLRRRILKAVDEPDTEVEMRRVAEVLEIDLEKTRRLVQEVDLRRARRGFRLAMERVGDSIGNSIVF